MATAAIALLATGCMDLSAPLTVPSAPAQQPREEAQPVEAVSNAALLSGFTEVAVFQNLTNPIAVRFAANGKVFVAEENGRIYVFDNLSDTSATLVADLRGDVNSYWDRGMLGFTVNPNFGTTGNNYLYALYTHDTATNSENNQSVANRNGTDNCPATPGGTSQGCVTYGKLVRIQDTGSGYPYTASSSQVQTLVEEWPQQFPSHAVGALNFGPDGFLYATAGDGASFSTQDWGQFGIPKNPLGDPPAGVGGNLTSPTSRGGSLRSQSFRRPSGENVVLNGTVIRINPATGAGATGNPNLSHADNDAKRIIAFGLRNPYRSTFHPTTGDLWIGDVGGNAFEEINRLPAPLTQTPMKNFGWPCREGPNASSNWTGFNMCSGSITFTAPHYSYAHDTATYSGDTCTTVGSSAISGLAFYPTTGAGNYPTAYRNNLFYADVTRKCIWLMTPDANGIPTVSSRKVFISNANNPVDLQIGPNNDLFYVDYGGSGGQGTNAGAGKVWRVRYQSPTAIATANPTSGFAPLTVQYTGSMSTPGVSGDTLSYAWDLDGDGQYDDSTSINPSRTYNTAMTFNARLRVTDQRGGVGESAPIQIVVGNTTMPPVPVIDTPTAALTWKVGDTISFTGHATDPEDGTIPASGLLWDVIMQHCPATCHEHLVQSFDGVASGSFPAPDHEYPSYLQLRLTATDSHGVRTTVTRDLQPQTVQLTLQALPSLSPGLNIGFNLDGSFATPFTRTVILGSLNTLIAPTQTRGNTQYTFQSWSNGGAGSQTITADASATYTATFNATVNPWSTQDIGTNSVAGSWSETGGVHTVAGNGADIWGTVDAFRFTHQQLTGDGTITARLLTFNSPSNANGKAGVMIRQSLAANSAHVMAAMPPQGTTTLIKAIKRVSTGASASVAETGATPAYPRWLRVVRSGATLTAYDSTNGTTFTQLGTPTTVTGMTGTVYIGLAVTSHTNGTNGTATFDNVVITTPAPPTPPPAPAGLMATAGNAQVALSWGASTGATSYTVLRSTTMGSGHTSVQTGITGTTFTNTSLTNGTTYYYVVRAVNGAGASGDSNEASATPQLPLPQSPTNLVATAGNAQVGLTWSAVAGAASYTVKRGLTIGGPYTDATFPGLTGTSYSDTGLTNGTTYYYVVSASNTTGESGNSNQASATPQPPPPPSAPTGLAATGGSNQVALTWNAVSGAASYTVKRSLDSGGPYDDFVAPGLTSTSYTDISPANGTTYFYVVTATNANGESGNSNQVSVTPQPAPSPPTNLVATAGNTTVALSWTASAGATSYRVKRATAAGGPYTSVQAGLTATSFNDTGRTNGTTYYYVVTASTGSAESADSSEASATPQPSAPGAPTGLAATAGNAQVALTWSATSGATSYTVKRATTSGGPYTDVQSGITVTSFTNTGLTNGTTYYYVVSASNGGGQGPNSSQVSATPSSGPTWFQVNVGGATPEGSYTVSGSTHTIVGGGADFQGNAVAGQADQFKWVYREITGNATITARITRLDNVGTQTFVKGGLMMRASTAGGAIYASALTTNTAANDYRHQHRAATDAAVTQERGLDSTLPTTASWLRLVKNGTSISAYSSANGTTWTLISTTTLTLPTTYQVGFAVTSHQQGTSTTAVFDNLTITTP